MLRNRIIWFDLETGGLNPFHHPIIEIAAVDNYGNAFQSLIRNDRPLDPKIVEITKITDEMLEKEGREHRDVINDFYSYINTGVSGLSTSRKNSRTFMIAHNGDSFDRMFIKTAFKKYDITIPSSIYFIDSLHLAKLVMPERSSFKQEYIAEKFKINNPNAHRAMGDVIVLREIWQRLAQKFGEMNGGKDDIIAIYNYIYF